MVKFGPFCRRDSCPGVRGVLERLNTHFLMCSSVLHVCLELEGGCLGAVVGAMGAESILEEGVEAMGVAGIGGMSLVLEEVVEILDGTFDCPLKAQLVLLKSCEFLAKL